MTRTLVVILSVAVLLGCATQTRSRPTAGYRGWSVYAGGPESIRYSTLTQIDRSNVHQLQVAWRYDSGDAFKDSEMQCNPIIVDGVLYATSPMLRVFALDAATGQPLWSFSPPSDGRDISRFRNRGLTYWRDGDDRRIYVVVRQYFFSLDARTGKPVVAFGRGGRVDLREGLGRDPETLRVTVNTPPIVYKDLIITGSTVPEYLPAAPGDIRAYDARTS